MKLTSSSAFLGGFYLALLVFWFAPALAHLSSPFNPFVFFRGIEDEPYNFIFAFAYGIIPIVGGILGFIKAERWGFFKSTMGKALLFMSVGLITWGYGEMIWSFYNFFLNQDIPYPSWADAFFIVSWPLWAIGMFYLGRATGIKYGLRKKSGQFLLVALPLLAAAISYYLLVTVARQGEFVIEGDFIKIFLDLAYPIGDLIILTLASLVYGLSFKYLGGRFKWPVIITLLGFVINYIADVGFSYTTTVGSFYNGNWVDLVFATAMFVISFGVNSFDIKD